MKLDVTALYEKTDDGWWVAIAPEIPGAHSQGKTLEEAREMLADAIRELSLARREMLEEELDEQSEIIRETLHIDLV